MKTEYETLCDIENSCVNKVVNQWNCQAVFTDKVKNKYSEFDGIFFKENTIKGFFEVKVRKQTLSWFKDYKSILVSYNKITSGQVLSKCFNCCFFLIVKTSCNKILVFKVTDENGNVVYPMNVRYTETQKSTTFDKGKNNKKIGTNAYLLLEDNPNLYIFDY